MHRVNPAIWIAAGFIVAALLLPTGALSAVATSLVTVTSKDGKHSAGVTPASQEQVAEAAPSTFVRAEVSGGCSGIVYAVPAGKALVITNVDYFLRPGGETDRPSQEDLESGPIATPCTAFLDAGMTPAGTAVDSIAQEHTFQPGIAIPTGNGLSLLGDNDDGLAFIYGYLVPASAVPASAAITSGAPSSRSQTGTPMTALRP